MICITSTDRPPMKKHFIRLPRVSASSLLLTSVWLSATCLAQSAAASPTPALAPDNSAPTAAAGPVSGTGTGAAGNGPAEGAATSEPAYGARLEGFDYPYPVSYYDFHSQRQDLQMAYMDVKPEPAMANGRTAVLLHGKNYCAATWAPTMEALRRAGYRVIAVDQIGFCKSSKPEHYQFSFQQLARNTNDLLQSLGVTEASIIGHSTGGMLGVRYALGYASQTQQLVLVNPIGLEDWRARGVPPVSVDEWYKRELGTTAQRIRNYEKATYFNGQWRAEYEPSVQMLAGMYRGPGKNLVAWNSALLYDMILTQPVVYELPLLKVPTLLLIGDKDTTAIGKDLAPPEVRPTLGNYPQLARQTAAAIPGARLVMFPGTGHAPQMQTPEAFHTALLSEMSRQGGAGTKY